MSGKGIFLLLIMFIGAALLVAGITSPGENRFFKFNNKFSIALGLLLIGLAMYLR